MRWTLHREFNLVFDFMRPDRVLAEVARCATPLTGPSPNPVLMRQRQALAAFSVLVLPPNIQGAPREFVADSGVPSGYWNHWSVGVSCAALIHCPHRGIQASPGGERIIPRRIR
jgi:hypothetical protein